MFINSPFAPARGSFERPVPLVLVDPCAEPTVTVRINREWIPYILGALKQLVLQATWDTDDPAALDLVQARAMSLLSCIGVSLDEPGCECGCAEYPPSAEFVTWAPENPYTNPTDVPPGYRFPPWYVVGGSIPFTGLQAGDVLTDLAHGPIVEPISSGFPRFRVTCSGTGTVEITFVRFPTAGVALIAIDGQVGTSKFIDLHISLAASVGTADGEMIIPIEISTPGDHFIDITMLYSITEAPPFVHFGGAIRKVALCGFGVSPHAVPITQFVELMGDDMPICTQLRWHNGKLQGLCCFDPATGEMTWEDIPGQGDTVTDGGAQPAPESRPDPGESKCYFVKLDGNGQWNLPFGVSTDDIITITDAKGGWSDGTAAWYCQNGQNYVAGGCLGTGHTDSGDPIPLASHMTLIGLIPGVGGFDLGSSPYTVPAGAAGSQLTFQANDSALSDNAGSITFKVCVENGSAPPAGNWCYVWDFTVNDGGWSAFVYSGEDQAQYVTGQGWGRTGPISAADGIFILSPVAASATTFTRMIIEMDALPTTGHAAGKAVDKLVTTNLAIITADQIVYDLGPFSYTDDQICAAFDPYVGGGATTSLVIKRVTLYGTGSNPFGTSNC